MLSQLSLSRAACEKAAAQDLKSLMKTLADADADRSDSCRALLTNYYCELVEDRALSMEPGVAFFERPKSSVLVSFSESPE
jgi:hypothetical protein